MIWRVGFKLVVSQKKKKTFFLKFPPPHQVIMSREHELINACWPAPADGRLRPQAARYTDRVHGPGTALSGDPRGQRLSFAFSPTSRVHASSESREKIEWTPGAGAPRVTPRPMLAFSNRTTPVVRLPLAPAQRKTPARLPLNSLARLASFS